MRKEAYAILLIISALVFRELFLLFPASPETFDPFPYADVEISLQSYVYFFCYYGSNLLLIVAFMVIVEKYALFFNAWFLLQIVELADYYFTYNTAWFKVGTISVGITLVKIVTLTITIITQWIWEFYYKRDQ